MKSWSKVICVAAVAALAALCLVACGGGSGSGSASGSSEAGPTYEPIYVVKHMTVYSSMDGEVTKTMDVQNAYDERGNNTEQIRTSIDPMTNEEQTITRTWSDFDEYGYPTKYADDDEDSTTKWTIVDGQAVKCDDGYSIAEFAYYDDGKLKSQTLNYDEEQVVVEYDEYGYQISSTFEGGEHPQKTEIVWTRDDKGNVVSSTRTTTQEDGQTFTMEYTVECDENGNPVKVSRDGALAYEFEYQKIDNPTQWAWVKSFMSQF